MKWRDGTPFNPPKNPLKEKWDKLYPSCQDSWDYGCMFCGKCHFGDHWKIPKEDRELWNQFQSDMDAYVEAHGGWNNLLLELNVDYKLSEQGERA